MMSQAGLRAESTPMAHAASLLANHRQIKTFSAGRMPQVHCQRSGSNYSTGLETILVHAFRRLVKLNDSFTLAFVSSVFLERACILEAWFKQIFYQWFEIGAW